MRALQAATSWLPLLGCWGRTGKPKGGENALADSIAGECVELCCRALQLSWSAPMAPNCKAFLQKAAASSRCCRAQESRGFKTGTTCMAQEQ